MKRPSTSGALLKRPAAAAEEELQVEDEQAVEEKVEEKQPKSGSGANVISSISHKAGWKEQMVETKSGRQRVEESMPDIWRKMESSFLAVPKPLKMVSGQIRSELEHSWRMKKSQQHAAAKQHQYHHVEPYMTQSTLIVKPPTFPTIPYY